MKEHHKPIVIVIAWALFMITALIAVSIQVKGSTTYQVSEPFVTIAR